MDLHLIVNPWAAVGIAVVALAFGVLLVSPFIFGEAEEEEATDAVGFRFTPDKDPDEEDES